MGKRVSAPNRPSSSSKDALGSARRRADRASRSERAGTPLVGVIMGSQSDWETMSNASATLEALGVAHETRVVSAHRTPDLLFRYADDAEARGIRVIIAGAGGAAHLPGMCASKTTLPVLGVPVESKALQGLDSLLSIAQMPAGIPVGALAIGRAGAVNAALLAAAILALHDDALRERLKAFRVEQTEKVLKNPDPRANTKIARTGAHGEKQPQRATQSQPTPLPLPLGGGSEAKPQRPSRTRKAVGSRGDRA